MKKAKNIVVGLILILIGVLLLLKSLGVIEDFNIFFEGWWTLFIIVPSVIGLFTDEDKTGSLIGILVGVLLLLAVRDIISFELIWKLLVPVIIIIIGLSFIFKDLFSHKLKEKIENINNNELESFTATFAGQKYNVGKQEFKGGDINAIFGGVELDLRDAKIKEDVVIKLCAVFGGVDIFVPEDVNVKIVSTALFGGIDDKRKRTEIEGKNTIYIDATCIFGGADIK